jgi:phosphatidylglycerol:prolipoprotein diacylglycerol transferase
MYPILIDLGKFELYTYGLFVGIGFLTAIWFSKKNAQPHGISPETITDIFLLFCCLPWWAHALYMY